MAGLPVLKAMHENTVKTLYRQCLVLLRNWAANDGLFLKLHPTIRQKFEANRNLSDPGLIEKRLRETQANLFHYRHPAPYINPYHPGGSAYNRTPSIPQSVNIYFDEQRRLLPPWSFKDVKVKIPKGSGPADHH